MIPLRRLPREQALSPEVCEELDRLQALVNGGTTEVWKNRFSGKPHYQVLRTALLQMSLGKCAYCEQEAVGFEVEHVRPKALHPARTFDWVNFLPSCGPCNKAKGAIPETEDSVSAVLDPVGEDPGAHIKWGENGWGRPRKKIQGVALRRTERTLSDLGLNKASRPGARQRALLDATWALDAVERDPSPKHIEALIESLRPNAPHRAILRQWFHHPVITARLAALEAAHPILTPTLKFYRDLSPPTPSAV
jgi:uncharacterized protein (TIGR02646 family)